MSSVATMATDDAVSPVAITTTATTTVVYLLFHMHLTASVFCYCFIVMKLTPVYRCTDELFMHFTYAIQALVHVHQ